MHDAHKSDLAKSAFRADSFVPVLKHLEAYKRKLRLRRKAIVHTDQCRRSAATAAAHVIFVDDDDAVGFATRQLKRDRRTHYPRANDDEVGRFGNSVAAHAASLSLPFFQSRNT